MNKILTLIFLFLIAISANGQFINEKSVITQGSYGEKKFKKAPKKVYIAQFQVYFNVIATETAKTTAGRQIGGGSYKGDTETSMTVAVEGVDVTDFQLITDNVYQNFVKQLKEKGFEVISTADAAKIPFYEGWSIKPGGSVNYANIPGYVSVVPNGLDYMVKKENDKGREKGTFIDRTPKISKELDNAIVIEASFSFPFIKMQSSSSNMIGLSSVKARTDFSLGTAFGADGMTGLYEPTKVKFVSGNPVGAAADALLTYNLKGEIEIPGVFADEKFKERTVASTTMVPAYYSIIFIDNNSSTVTHQAKCDPIKYVETTQSILNEYIDYSLKGFFSTVD